MDKAEIETRQNGTGYLVLKNGSGKQVQWEVDFLRDGSLGEGCIRGDEAHLAAAAKTHAPPSSSRPKSRRLLRSTTKTMVKRRFHRSWFLSNVFQAQTINGSKSFSDGNQFVIEFSDANGKQFVIIVPTIVLRDYLPVFEKTMRPFSPRPQRQGSFNLPERGRRTIRSYPFVLLGLNDEQPFALGPEEARELARRLIEGAKEVDNRSQTAQ